MADPRWQEAGRTSNKLHMIFITQCLNVYAMFLVKASIRAYLLALKFVRSYRVLVWVSVVVVVMYNFIMMLNLHFAYCRPYFSRWDFSMKQECWPASVSEATAYVQIASNIFTDLVSASDSFEKCKVIIPSRLMLLPRSSIFAKCNPASRLNGVSG